MAGTAATYLVSCTTCGLVSGWVGGVWGCGEQGGPLWVRVVCTCSITLQRMWSAHYATLDDQLHLHAYGGATTFMAVHGSRTYGIRVVKGRSYSLAPPEHSLRSFVSCGVFHWPRHTTKKQGEERNRRSHHSDGGHGPPVQHSVLHPVRAVHQAVHQAVQQKSISDSIMLVRRSSKHTAHHTQRTNRTHVCAAAQTWRACPLAVRAMQ